MGPDLRTITGTVQLDPSLTPYHPLPKLPEVTDDLTWLRTYPGRADAGEATLEPVEPGLWRFTTRLPRRFGDVGATRHGLFANGWWHPLLPGDEPALYTVELELPPAAVGALGATWGKDALRWEGQVDRVPLAVLPAAESHDLGRDITLLSRRPVGKRRLRELRAMVDAVPEVTDGVFVIAPLRRRLARSGPGLAYISDRSFRLTPPLHAFHRAGVARGALPAVTGLSTDFARGLAGSGLVRRHHEDLRGPSAREALGFFSWLPIIDYILYDRTLPFHADVLGAAFPSDPLLDDLAEATAPHLPSRAAAAQLADAYGDDAVDALTTDLLAGAPLLHAGRRAGVSLSLLAGMTGPRPEQDYTLEVFPAAITITREAPDDAPPEVLVVRRDREAVARVLPAGPGTWTLPRNDASRVRLDPGHHTPQTRRLGDAYPQRFRATVTGGIGSINLSEGWVTAGAALYVRRSGDNRNSAALALSTSRDAWIGATASYTRRFGRELSGLSRRHRVTVSASTRVLNQRFADEDDLPLTVSTGLGWSWTNRQGGLFPLRGWRLFASTQAGYAPGTSQDWIAASTTAVRLVPLHPRLVWASRGTVGLARSDVRGQLLSLGGGGAVGGLSYGAAFGTRRAALTTELRVVPLRNLSVPLLLLWGTELQLSAGVEAGTIGTPDGAEHAVGATFGIAGVGDIFGAQPYLLGLTMGVPLWWTDGVPDPSGPQITLRWSQDF